MFRVDCSAKDSSVRHCVHINHKYSFAKNIRVMECRQEHSSRLTQDALLKPFDQDDTTVGCEGQAFNLTFKGKKNKTYLVL